ncbi:16S rRNA (uracil(1498)-N(3))-methyltransferase [Lederbergia lenta]|uniref:Ribosomal RNA small subunit methyltransferase E n=1 Tax=Lederbergia lenta TaxID=1467 RepID=A0A2X4VYN8_LEDLE|nr:16S rRNA (uracil(1498)-N(3))-methyltransferase [Lederbergia lenta]MCM3111369.1 16S rRNA (uracil(1498)-N(3))-methyltransferase [Lederbergia lenta]MEC2325244.1 16S rRNA (uracil(1498)-N(3))-methyltransferase [Lederbergia lenta]SQI55893.1 16S ribosomal RNA methyltransferase RsmE [Lederbergia lenta]
MQRYFINEPFVNQKRIEITGDDYHHIVRVMRMKMGDEILIVTNDGKVATASIEQVTDVSVEASVTSWEEESKELPVQIVIASGLPKGDKLEWIIQKGTELGASEFVPFIAGRSIVKWEEKKAVKKLERWNKIAKEAAEQSHRQILPSVHAPLSFKELIQLGEQCERKIVAYEEVAKYGEQSNFAEALNKTEPGNKVLLVFGPEGGMTEKEANELHAHGFILCGLGPRILRTETAPLYALAAISYHFELMR